MESEGQGPRLVLQMKVYFGIRKHEAHPTVRHGLLQKTATRLKRNQHCFGTRRASGPFYLYQLQAASHQRTTSC
jgi:hypothetical protein